MITIIFISLSILLILPILVALAEAQRPAISSFEEGYWTVARALLGGCHVKWLPDPLPVIWFDVGLSQGRIHLFKRAGDQSWWFEGRVYLSQPLGFAARLATPVEEFQAQTFPKMVSVVDEEPEVDLQLKNFTIETNASPRLMRCLSADEVRPLLKSLKATLKLHSVEFIMAHQVFVVRGNLNSSSPPSELVERFGPQLANWFRLIISPLNQFSGQLLSREGELCPASAIDLSEGEDLGEVWGCHLCGTRMYRVAMEVMKGCVNPACENTIDGVAEEVIHSGRPQVEIHEVSPEEVGDHGWIT